MPDLLFSCVCLCLICPCWISDAAALWTGQLWWHTHTPTRTHTHTRHVRRAHKDTRMHSHECWEGPIENAYVSGPEFGATLQSSWLWQWQTGWFEYLRNCSSPGLYTTVSRVYSRQICSNCVILSWTVSSTQQIDKTKDLKQGITQNKNQE